LIEEASLEEENEETEGKKESTGEK
jgi:hypothetical protein